jgi:trigger factor
MKSTIETTSGLKRTLKIEVDQNAVKAAFEKEFQKIQKDLVLPGFRKGKAPMDQVRATYKGRVINDVVENLVNQNYFEALKEHNLHPVSMPQIDLEEITEDKGFSFKATLEVKPEIKLSKYKNFELTKKAAKVDDEKIQNIINQILESKSEKVPVFEDRPAQEKDLLDINFEGFLSPEEPLPNGAANNFILELGSQSFIPGFEEGLIGAKAGSERTLDLSFPEDYQAAEIAGKNVSFKVKINKILKKQLPALDDQLVESLGDPKIKTAEQLKEGIASDLLKSEEDQSIKAMQEEVLKALIENNPMELPESLVAQQKEGLKANSKQTLVAQGFGEAEMDDYYKKWDEDFTKNARDIIHVSLLMDAIADSEKLRPTEKEIDEKIQEMANQAGPNGSKVKEYYSDINRKDSLYYKLMEDRVISYVIENSKIKEA